MNAIQQLIADYLAENPGETYSSIARRGDMSRSTVYSLATKEERRQTPHPDTIRGLAKGMGMDESFVRAAAGDAAGYRATTTSDLTSENARLVVEATRHLDEERMRILAVRAKHLMAEQRELAGENDT